jgi:hypothetical protein
MIRCRGIRTERLLLEDQKDGVDELDVLDVVVDHVVRDESLFISHLFTSFRACAMQCV